MCVVWCCCCKLEPPGRPGGAIPVDRSTRDYGAETFPQNGPSTRRRGIPQLKKMVADRATTSAPAPAAPRQSSAAGTLHRAPVGQGPPGPGWLAISFGFWPGRALATGTAWAGLCLIHHHQRP